MKGIFFENKRILILFFFFSTVFLSISFFYSFSSSSSGYEGYCTGICNRSSLIVYYVEDDKVIYKEYSDLFSQDKYCKNGAIHEDKNEPSVSLRLGSRNWGNTDITETLNCSDHDESGCWKYNYKIIRVV